MLRKHALFEHFFSFELLLNRDLTLAFLLLLLLLLLQARFFFFQALFVFFQVLFVFFSSSLSFLDGFTVRTKRQRERMQWILAYSCRTVAPAARFLLLDLNTRRRL